MEYRVLCEAYAAIEATSKRLEKTRIIADLLVQASDTDAPVNEDIDHPILLLQGRAFPAVQKEHKLGVSSQLMLKVLARVTGSTVQQLEKEWSKLGDLGLVAEKKMQNKAQSTLFAGELHVHHIIKQLRKLTTTEGTGSVETKLQIISELFSNASPQEARYLTRTVLEDLRIGIATQTLRDGIIYAFLAKEAGIEQGEIADRDKYNAIASITQTAYDKTNDFTVVAKAAQQGVDALKEIKITMGTPLKVMLGMRGTTVADAIEKLGVPLMLQYKYDGFRVEIHKEGDGVQIFTRRLENVTTQFPDIVENVRKAIQEHSCMLDGEAIGIDTETGRYKPFQEISQRIRRKYDIQETAEKLPVDVRIFDITTLNGEELLEHTLEKRHNILHKIITPQKLFSVAHTLIATNEKEGQAFYEQALADGEEGIFAKKLDSTYQPGARVGNWIKIKNIMEPIDVVIIGAEWGEGKRSGWFTSFDIAVLDEEGMLVQIGKVATGLKEKEEEGFSFPEITQLLEPLVEHTEGKHATIKPEIVLEVAYEEIQRSPSYESGYALRFPRIRRNRTDERSVEDATHLTFVEELFHAQRTQH